MSIGFSKKLRGGIFECHLVATCDKVCNLVPSWHEVVWLVFNQTGFRSLGYFDQLIPSGHFDPLVSVVQFRPLIFHKSTGCFRPMILSSVWTKTRKIACIFRVFFVFVTFWVRMFVHKSGNTKKKFPRKM